MSVGPAERTKLLQWSLSQHSRISAAPTRAPFPPSLHHALRQPRGPCAGSLTLGMHRRPPPARSLRVPAAPRKPSTFSSPHLICAAIIMVVALVAVCESGAAAVGGAEVATPLYEFSSLNFTFRSAEDLNFYEVCIFLGGLRTIYARHQSWCYAIQEQISTPDVGAIFWCPRDHSLVTSPYHALITIHGSDCWNLTRFSLALSHIDTKFQSNFIFELCTISGVKVSLGGDIIVSIPRSYTVTSGSGQVRARARLWR